jgi:hypothetical protein
MKLDLRKDFDEIYSHLVHRVQNYTPGVNVLHDPGGVNSPIAQITFGYELTQAGWVVLAFDARSDAKSDGEWSRCIDETMLARPEWLRATKSLGAGEAVEFKLTDGSVCTLSPKYDDAEYGAVYGNLLKWILLKAHEDGVFRSLPLAERCQLAVEDFDFRYGWTLYDDRGDKAADA